MRLGKREPEDLVLSINGLSRRAATSDVEAPGDRGLVAFRS